MSPQRPLAAQTRFRWFVIGPFLVAVALLAALGVTSARCCRPCALRRRREPVVEGAERSGVHLVNYASSRDAADYRKFADAIAVPLGDRSARLALDQPVADLTLARHGFIQGGNHPDDIDAMVWLFRNFRRVPFMADAIEIWSEADVQLAALNDLADQIHQRVQAGERDSPPMRALLGALTLVNERLTLLEQRFSATMGDASRLTQRLVQAATLLLALTLAGAAVLFSTRQLRQQARGEQALRTSQERLQRALEASHLCLWDCDVRSGEVYLSEEWSLQLGGPPRVTRTTMAALLDRVPVGERDGVREALRRALAEPQAGYRVEHRVLRPDGTPIWVLSEGRVVARSVEGRALRMVGTNRDISEHKAAEASASRSSPSCATRRRWRRSARWPAGSPTTSTTSWARC
jgi:PAS domain S-box-containing protein